MIRRTGIMAINERLAQKIRREAKENPNSPYANRFVGLANGRVVVIADSLGSVDESVGFCQTAGLRPPRMAPRCGTS
jgi:hypothetical protein